MEENFTTYEYLTKTVKRSEQSLTTDVYGAFGWEPADAAANALGGVTLTFKRDRKLPHKTELNRLQRKAEGLKEGLERLRTKQTGNAKLFAYTFGAVAALIFGTGMCLTMLWGADLTWMAAGIAVGIFGIVLCGLNVLFYRRLAKRSTEKALPQIEEAEEKLATVCEQAHGLLNGDLI